MRERPDLKSVSDDKLLLGLFEILKRTRHDEAELAHIAEVDARKLYAREATSSMFVRSSSPPAPSCGTSWSGSRR